MFAGTYNPHTGLSHYHQCLGCPPGKFCNQSGLDAPSGDCLAGFLCVENATHPAPNDGTNMPCPAGHYCVDGKIRPVPLYHQGYFVYLIFSISKYEDYRKKEEGEKYFRCVLQFVCFPVQNMPSSGYSVAHV